MLPACITKRLAMALFCLAPALCVQGEESVEKKNPLKDLAVLEQAIAEGKTKEEMVPLAGDLYLSAREVGTPLTEGSTAILLYFGRATTVTASGAWSLEDGDGSVTLQRLAPLDLWIARIPGIPQDAEFLYRMTVDGKEGGDPLCKENHDGFGPNSVGRMPMNRPVAEMEYAADIPHGTLETFEFASRDGKTLRRLSVYLPHIYAKEPKRHFPVLYVQDGDASIGAGRFDRIADSLLARNAMQPIILCFIPPVNHVAEYWFEDQAYEKFIVDEIVPAIDTRYRTLREAKHRGITGASLGGRISTYLATKRPDLFGICIGQSSYLEKDSKILEQIKNSEQIPVRFYYDIGIFERGIGRNFGGDITRDLLTVNRDLQALLREKGCAVEYREWAAGHCMLTWGRGMAAALQLMWPGPNAAPQAGMEPSKQLQTEVKREGDKVWLEGIRGWAYLGKESSVHGAQSAIMQSVGEDVTYEYLMGVSGQAFRMQVFKKGLCPSSPHSCCGINCAEDAFNALPWKGEIYGGQMSDGEKAAVQKAIVESIDQGVPVQFGSKEDGLIIGYQKNGAEWICLHPLRDLGTKSFVNNQQQWPWGITVYSARKTAMPDRRKMVVASLQKAVKMANAPEDADANYYVGFKAWDEYFRVLESLDNADDKIRADSMQGNAHIYCCLSTYRAAATTYLRDVAGEFSPQASKHMKNAADLYDQIATKVLQDKDRCLTDIAPFPFMMKPGQTWTSGMRNEQVRRLREAKALEIQAIGEIEKALKEIG